MDKTPTLAAAIALLGRLDITIEQRPAVYRVNYRNGHERTAQYVEDLAEAIAIGGQMAAERPTAPPAPRAGNRITRRQMIRRHNRKWANKHHAKQEAARMKAQAATLQGLSFPPQI